MLFAVAMLGVAIALAVGAPWFGSLSGAARGAFMVLAVAGTVQFIRVWSRELNWIILVRCFLPSLRVGTGAGKD
ncbi:hypothetical protein D6850_04350 [Roseovarius spongiae]|uniref:Uncharacterized protein n=1 Tax=Roseovarius spongiae TaxID=2320272 RepID=A0A3A8B6J9_9RHOB|nr:hypothetical protein D6850_04350 [Roseovarius spongiae]